MGGQVGELLSHNVFAYCLNNPVNGFDPDGHAYYVKGRNTPNCLFGLKVQRPYKKCGNSAIWKVRRASMDKLTEIINNWDPTNLMAHAPDDEYELEVERINELLMKTEDEYELAKGIKNIFLETCGPEFFKKDFRECLGVARKILKETRNF